jgi:hypothetical protein
VPRLSKYRVLLVGVFSPVLALVLNVILIQILLALSPDPESNWRFRLLVSSLALPVPFLITLMFAWKDRRIGGLSVSAKIGLAIATLSLLLIAKPVLDGFARSKQSRNMAMQIYLPLSLTLQTFKVSDSGYPITKAASCW